MIGSWKNLDSGFIQEFPLESYFEAEDLYVYVCMAQNSRQKPNSIEIVRE